MLSRLDNTIITYYSTIFKKLFSSNRAVSDCYEFCYYTADLLTN